MTKEQISVPNMCCFSCAAAIEREVARLGGVRKAFVDYKKGTMDVEYDENSVKTECIEAAAQLVIKRMKDVC